MQVKFLLLILLGLLAPNIGWGQLFENRNLYDIWITADRYVNSGKFEEAIKLYEIAPRVPEFAKQIQLTRRIQVVFQEGERLYRAKKYPEALESFSRYREIAPDLHVALLDDRIQACLYQLEKVAVRKLAESTRVVAGFEYAYKGDKKLMVLDTLAALTYYTKARQLGVGLNSTLREQYQEGLKSVKALRTWGDEYRQAAATQDKARLLDVLRAYRSASKYIVSRLEYEIRSLEEGGLSLSGFPEERLKQYALDCRIEDLANYITSNSKSIQLAPALTQAVAEYLIIEQDIASLGKDPANSLLLVSTYRNLIAQALQIPMLGEAIQVCAKRRYFEYLVAEARLSERKGLASGEMASYREALRYVMEANQLGFTQFHSTLDELKGRLNSKLACEDRQRDFVRQLADVRNDLANCRIKAAKLAWDTSEARLAGCGLDEPLFVASYRAVRDSVNRFYTADSLFSHLNERVSQALSARQCEEAKSAMETFGRLQLCNTSVQDSLLRQFRERISQCEQSACYITARSKAFQSAENREWRKSYEYYQQAYACAPETQKVRLQEIMKGMECDAYPERCRGSNVSISLEPTLRAGINSPKYIENGTARQTSSGYLASAGLQLSFISYLSPLDFVLGLEYFQTEYQLLEQKKPAGIFKVSGADAYAAFKLHQSGTDPNRLRPYLKGGLELLLPLSYSLQNHYQLESTRDRSLLKKQSLGAVAGIGMEMQRSKYGFFVEVVGGYNFSGIYNANAITSSGARGKTEAHFRTLGIRLGGRIW